MRLTASQQVIKTKTGILLIDKPESWTSHDIVNRVRGLVGVKRVGHAGTLDPFATGLLVILIGREFTKQQAHFLKMNKQYLCSARLGVISDTYDITGQLTESASWPQIKKISRSQLIQQLAAFTGQISQVVPAYSAVKIKGRKLYELARRGQINRVDLPSKQVEIHQLQLLDFQLDPVLHQLEFSILVDCSSGTYIRSLIHDLGQQLEVGAVATALKRTKIGELDLSQAISLPQLQELATDFS